MNNKSGRMMVKFNVNVVLTFLMLALSFCANVYASSDGKSMVLNLRGTAVGYTAQIPAIAGSGTTEATCFDVQLYSLPGKRKHGGHDDGPGVGRQIGTATDCLADIEGVGEGVKLVGTTIFKFAKGSELVSRGLTTVQPVLHGSPGFTHITGAAPSGAGDILSGTKKFNNATGSVRLSGLVNMSRLNDLGQITFDCIFVVDLD